MNLLILLFCSFASSSTEQLTGKAVWTWKLDSRVILWFLFVLLSLYLFFHQLWKFIFLTTPFFILEQKQDAVITSHSSCAKIASHTSSVFTMQEYRKRQQQQREVLKPIRHTHTHTQINVPESIFSCFIYHLIPVTENFLYAHNSWNYPRLKGTHHVQLLPTKKGIY